MEEIKKLKELANEFPKSEENILVKELKNKIRRLEEILEKIKESGSEKLLCFLVGHELVEVKDVIYQSTIIPDGIYRCMRCKRYYAKVKWSGQESFIEIKEENIERKTKVKLWDEA